MEGVSLDFLAGLLAFSPNSSAKRRFMVDVLATVRLSNDADLIFLLGLVGERTAILFEMVNQSIIVYFVTKLKQ